MTTDKATSYGKALEKQIKALHKKPYVKVGVLSENFSEDKKVGTSKGKGKSNVPTLGETAVYNEFGTSNGRIPERSFIRWTHDNKKAEWIRRTNELRKRVMRGDITTEQALGLMGEMIQKDIKDRILSNISPANAQATIDQKTRDGNPGNRTLINFGQLLGSIHWSRHDGNH